MADNLRCGLKIWYLFIGTSWGHRDVDLLNMTFLYDGRLSRKNKLITLLHSPQSSANAQNRWRDISVAQGYQEYVYRKNIFLLYIGVQHELDCTERLPAK